MEEAKKVDSWDEEVTDKPAMKVSSWGEEVIDAPLKKKEPTNGSQGPSLNASKQVTAPSLESGGKDELKYTFSNQEPKTELLTGNYQQWNADGSRNAIPQLSLEVNAKIGKKGVGEYLTDKNTELLHGVNEMETANTISKYLSQSANYQQYQQKLSEYNEAVKNNDVAAQEKTQAELKNIEKFPLSIFTSPEQDNGIIKPTDEKIFSPMPKELKGAKTVGDAAKLAGELPAKYEAGKAKLDKAKAEIEEVAVPLRDAIGFDVNKHGVHEYGVRDAFMRGVMGIADHAATSLELLGAKDDQEYNRIVKEKLGVNNILFPEQPANKIAGAVETGAGLLPYFAASPLGTVGAAITNSLMMGASGYSQNALRTYQEVLAQTGNEQEATEASKKAGIGSGATGIATGGVLMPLMGVAGNITGSKVLGRAVADGEIGQLTIPEYLKYSLPKNAVSNLPFALQTYADNKIAQAAGSNRNGMNGVGGQLTAAIFIGSIVDGLHYGGAKLSPKVKDVYETALAKFGFPQTVQAVNEQVANNNITQQEADKILAPIESKAAALSQIPGNLTIKQEQLILPHVEEITKLEKEREKAPEAFHPQIDAEIEAQNRAVREKLGSPLTEKEQKEYEKIVEKRDTPATEGKEKPELLQSEKDKLAHYEARIEQAGKNEANKIAEDLGYDHAKHLLADIKKQGLGEFEKVQDVPKYVLDKVKRQYEVGDVVELNPTVTKETSNAEIPQPEPTTEPATKPVEEVKSETTETSGSFKDAKDGDVVKIQGKKWKVIGRKKSRGGNDVIELQRESLDEQTGSKRTQYMTVDEEQWSNEIAPTNEPQPKEERTTSAKNEFTDKELEELGLDPRDLPEVKANKTTWEKAKADVDSGAVDPMDIAEKALEEDAPFLSDEQVFALKYQKAKLLKEHDATYEGLQKAKADGDKDLENLYIQHLAKLNGDFDTVAKALGKAGTTAARSLQARGRETDMDYNLLAVNQRMREANGDKPIPEAVQKRIEELVAKNKEAEEKLKAHEERIAELEKNKVIQDEINAQLKKQATEKKITERQKKGDALIAEGLSDLAKAFGAKKMAVAENDASIATAVEKIARGLLEKGIATTETVWEQVKQKVKEAYGVDLPDSYRDNTEVEIAGATDKLKEKVAAGKELKDMKYALKKRQKELVEGGMKDHAEVTKTITDELNGMGLKVDQRAVRDVLSGYGEVRRPSPEQLDKDIRDQTAKMRLASGFEDVLKGNPPKKSGFQFDKPNPEIDALKRELKKLIKEQGLDEKGLSQDELWATAIETWRKRKATEIEQKKELLKKYQSGEIPAPKQKIVPKTPEDIKLQAEAQKYKHLIDIEKHKLELANRGKVEKVLDWIPKSKRFTILLGYKVLGKLAAAGAWQNFAFTPARKLIQTGLGKIPGIRAIAERAPTEGNLTPQALAKNYSQYWQKAAWDDVYNTLKTGKSEIDMINRQFHGDKDLGDTSWTDFVMNSHAAIKNLPKRSEYFTSVQSASEWAVKNGFDLKAPETQKMIHDLAYNNAVRNIFMNKNRVTDAYKMGIGYLERNAGIGGKFLASLLKVDMPIVQVPTNIANDVSSYTAGLAKAAWTLGYHGKGKAENLTPQQADHFMRSLGKQAVGAIGMAIAYSLYKNFGGFYHQGQKEKKDGPQHEQIMVGDNKKRLKISGVFLHHPGFVAQMFSADIQHQIEDAKAKGKTISIPEAMVKSVHAVAKTIPLLESPSETLQTLESSKSLSRTTAQAVAGYVPQVVKEIAKDRDTDAEGNPVKRKPETFTEQLMVNIPGLRERVKSEVQTIMDKRKEPTVKKTPEEKQALKEAKIETEEDLKKQAEDLGIEYIAPKSNQKKSGFSFKSGFR